MVCRAAISSYFWKLSSPQTRHVTLNRRIHVTFLWQYSLTQQVFSHHSLRLKVCFTCDTNKTQICSSDQHEAHIVFNVVEKDFNSNPDFTELLISIRIITIDQSFVLFSFSLKASVETINRRKETSGGKTIGTRAPSQQEPTQLSVDICEETAPPSGSTCSGTAWSRGLCVRFTPQTNKTNWLWWKTFLRRKCYCGHFQNR